VQRVPEREELFERLELDDAARRPEPVVDVTERGLALRIPLGRRQRVHGSADVSAQATPRGPGPRDADQRPQQQWRSLATKLDDRFIRGDALDDLGQEGHPGRHVPKPVCKVLQLRKRRAPAVQLVMDAPVEVTPEQSAACDDEHADQCDVAVDGAEAKVRVVQDHDRAQHAEHHVEPEPEACRAQVAQRGHALAQRIDEQQQHHAAADDAEGVAKPPLRGHVVFRLRVEP